MNTTNDQELPFAVSSETIQNMGIAQIILTQPLDFETQTSYQFMVIFLPLTSVRLSLHFLGCCNGDH